MKVLVVKLTSMGDVLHLMPALSDLQKAYPNASIDWVVEDSFKDIPSWHGAVAKVMTVSTRRWRNLSKQTRTEFCQFKKQLRMESYDLVIDAQGLMKSALIARLARLNKQGKRIGFCGKSIKESPAAWFYNQGITVARHQHAVDRLRQLFAQIFDYSFGDMPLDYAIKNKIELTKLPDTIGDDKPYIVLLHGTTWATKHLPQSYWRELANHAIKAGFQVKLVWGNELEKERAHWICENNEDIMVLPKLSITQAGAIINKANGVIAVDTGLGHLSAALGVPCVSIYGSTNATLTSAVGDNQRHIQTDYPCSPCLKKQCARLAEKELIQQKSSNDELKTPCYETLVLSDVWQQLESVMGACKT